MEFITRKNVDSVRNGRLTAVQAVRKKDQCYVTYFLKKIPISVAKSRAELKPTQSINEHNPIPLTLTFFVMYHVIATLQKC